MKKTKYLARHDVTCVVISPGTGRVSRRTVRAGEAVSVSRRGKKAYVRVGENAVLVDSGFMDGHFERRGLLSALLRLIGG